MDLRRYLFEHRITQVEVCRTAQKLGHCLWPGDLTKVVNRRRKAFPTERRSIAAALRELGHSVRDISTIDELKEPAGASA